MTREEQPRGWGESGHTLTLQNPVILHPECPHPGGQYFVHSDGQPAPGFLGGRGTIIRGGGVLGVLGPPPHIPEQ